jgi:phospholipid/cholesterol/gamma-HCH transport system permease protein
MSSEQPQSGVVVQMSRQDQGRMVLTLAGRLEARTLADAWEQAVGSVRESGPRQLTVDAAGLSYCDGAGLGLFAELRRLMTAGGGQIEFAGVSPELQRLLDMSLLEDPSAGPLVRPPRPGLVVYVGQSAWQLFQDLHQIISFIGELTAGLLWALLHPFRIRHGDVLQIAEKAGANALPVVSLLGLLVGVILAFQTETPLERYGAQPLIPTIVSIAVVREMAALITAIILAGRSGSAFAAEIGTMKVTEELSALKTLGLEPMQFLVVPRVLAALTVTPLLTAFNMLMSMIGGYIVMRGLGYSLSFYVNSILAAVTVSDLLGGLFKSLVFAMIVAGVGCLRGTQTRSGPGAVGDSTTRAVVAGIVLTIAADAVLGVVYFYLGI